MIRNSSHLDVNIFDKINNFHNSARVLCDEVIQNMDMIKSQIDNNPSERQSTSLLACSIQAINPELAKEINYYVFKYFFGFDDIVKHLATFVANPVETSTYKSSIGLEAFGCVSKNFDIITKLAKQDWIIKRNEWGWRKE